MSTMNLLQSDTAYNVATLLGYNVIMFYVIYSTRHLDLLLILVTPLIFFCTDATAGRLGLSSPCKRTVEEAL